VPRRQSRSEIHQAVSSDPSNEGPLRLLSGPAWLTIILVCAGSFLSIMLALSIANDRGFLTMWRMQREVAQLVQEVRKLEVANEELLRNIERLRHDQAYIEKIAREELGLVRSEELVFEYVQ
jgi:cell division protein FtsB